MLCDIYYLHQVYTWSGGLEIGVTKCIPDCLDSIPSNATDLKNGTWVHFL